MGHSNIVCRCEDITEEEIRNAIRENGFTTMDEVRKNIRAGMGPCQGRTCQALVRRILSEETGQKIEEILPPKTRQPSKPVEISVLLEE
jgi:NAD(P)H-nitrite reductase large subunit